MAFDYASKVRGLLAKAESERELGNDVAADAYTAKAMRLMADYNVAQEEAIAQDATAAVPTHLVMDIHSHDWALSHHLCTIVRQVANHTGVMVNIASLNAGYRFTLVGYDLDLRHAEFLITASHLMFATRITPTWSDERSESDNIFFLRNAGIERREIAEKAWGKGAGAEAKNRSKVQRIYLREAATRGEEARATGLGFDTKTYREAYAESFVTTLIRRLREARDAANSVGALPALAGRVDRVREAYTEMFPPAPVTDVKPWVDPTQECAKCAKVKTTCNEHSYMRPRAWTQRDEIAAQRREYSTSARAGRASGKTAAEAVNVSRGHTTASRLDASGIAIEKGN
jgi:hypothetical protein